MDVELSEIVDRSLQVVLASIVWFDDENGVFDEIAQRKCIDRTGYWWGIDEYIVIGSGYFLEIVFELIGIQ